MSRAEFDTALSELIGSSGLSPDDILDALSDQTAVMEDESLAQNTAGQESQA